LVEKYGLPDYSNLPSTKLSTFVSVAEFTASTTAARKGLDNSLPTALIPAAAALCQTIVDPTRTHFKAPALTTSGYRGKALNRAVGGSTTSQHCKGEAVDFTIEGKTVAEVFNWIAFESGLPFDQLIYEFGRWVHVSYRREGDNRGQILRADKIKGRTVYSSVTTPV
jgi:hypothetical protein